MMSQIEKSIDEKMVQMGLATISLDSVGYGQKMNRLGDHLKVFS